MKIFDLDYTLIKAMPAEGPVDTLFTERVMQSVLSPSLESIVNNTHSSHKRSLLFRFRHLPRFAIVLLALAFLLTVSGATYAIVETVKQAGQKNVKLEASHMNEQGRQQLSVTFDNCDQEKKDGTTYELKKDSGLSAEEGANVLQAQCERDSIIEWIEKDPTLSKQIPNPNSIYSMLRTDGFVGTFQGINESGIALHSTTAFSAGKQDQTVPLPKDARVVDGGKIVDSTALKSGDTVLYFTPRSYSTQTGTPDLENVIVFKLDLDAKYYGLDMQSYVRARQPCENNEARTCVVSNHINTVNLDVSRGGAPMNTSGELANKVIQGKIVSWSDQAIKLDVGSGKIYTFHTDSNVIDTYNQTTVYGLKSYDAVYAKTNPEDLKIGVGDSLEVDYAENAGSSASVLEWSQIQDLRLMVERSIGNLEILHKY